MPPRKGTPAYDQWRNSSAYHDFIARQRRNATEQWAHQDRDTIGQAIRDGWAKQTQQDRGRYRAKCQDRERRQNYTERTAKFRETYYSKDVEQKREQSRINGRKAIGRVDPQKLSSAQKRRWADPKARQRHGEKIKAAWARKTPEQRKLWVRNLIESRCQPMNQGEARVLQLAPSSLRFTGDRKKLIRLPEWPRHYKNPDFVVEPFSHTRAVVELFGGRDLWHTENEAAQLHQAYAAAGYRCIIIWYDEMQRDPEGTKEQLWDFCGEDEVTDPKLAQRIASQAGITSRK